MRARLISTFSAAVGQSTYITVVIKTTYITAVAQNMSNSKLGLPVT